MRKKLFPIILASLFILTGSLVFADDCLPCEKEAAKVKKTTPAGSADCAPCSEYSPCDYNFCAPCCVPVKKHHRHRQSRYCGYQYSCCTSVCSPCSPPPCAPCMPCAPCTPVCIPCAPCCPSPCAPLLSPCGDNGCGYNCWNNCCYSGCHKKFHGKKCHHRAARGYYGSYSCCNPCCF